jgi:hypothetical protein
MFAEAVVSSLKNDNKAFHMVPSILTNNTIKSLSGLLLLLASSVSHAADFVVTPFAGFRTSDSLEDDQTEETIDLDEASSFGVILSMRQPRGKSYDLLFSRQDTDLLANNGALTNNVGVRIDYIHLGGTVDYEADGLYPFATGGLGVTRFSATDQDLSTETKFSMALGGGLKVPLSENVGLRFEGRVYGTVINGDTQILCINGACIAEFNGSLFLQFEANLGLSVAF